MKNTSKVPPCRPYSRLRRRYTPSTKSAGEAQTFGCIRSSFIPQTSPLPSDAISNQTLGFTSGDTQSDSDFSRGDIRTDCVSLSQWPLSKLTGPAMSYQETTHSLSLSDPETFWSYHANRLHWQTKPTRALTQQSKTLPSGASHQSWSWFADGEISTTYNCIDRHVLSGNGHNIAIIWESPVTGTTEKYTYAQLLDEIEVLAGVLREEGVKRGDVVLIYSTDPSHTPKASHSNRISAYDPCCLDCLSSNNPAGRNPRCRLRRLCICSSSAAHRCCPPQGYHDRLVWNRGFQGANRVSATRRRSCENCSLQAF